MNFSSADKVASVLEDLKQGELTRTGPRALINDLANGLPPYTRAEEEENNILVNINFKNHCTLLHKARRQYQNAFLKSGNYFTIKLDSGPVSKRREWSRVITRHINKALKKSLSFMEAYRSKFAGVVLHGVGPMMFKDQWCPFPETFGIEDLLVPTDTLTTLDNLYYFARRRSIKPGELFRKTFGTKESERDAGWDMDSVKLILDSYRDLNQNPHQWNFSEHPEKMTEIYKQNQTYYDSDSAPTIWFWDFYFQEEEDEGGAWNRRLLLDQDYVPAVLASTTSPIKFIYQRDAFAEELNQILHIQFGDTSNKPPFTYHGVRSIGWLLYDVCHMANRLQCSFTEHVFEQMMFIVQVADPNDRSRIEKFLLQNKGIIPEGTKILPANERYAVDEGLVNMLMSEFRQFMAESTASYTHDTNDGTQKERTATEVMTDVQNVNQLTSSLIDYAYLREAYAYMEICRRFCIKDSPESDVKKFQMLCLQDGVPEQYLDVDKWDVMPERVLGGGNKVLAIAEAKELQGMRPHLDPESQREVDRIAIAEITDDEKLANELVPHNPQGMVTDAIHDADLAFGTLMQGIPIRARSGFSHEEQIEELLRLMGGKIQFIMQSGGVGTPQDVMGLQSVAQYVQGHIQYLAQDKTEKKKVHEFGKTLGKLMNLVKAMAQRQQQAAKAAQAKRGQPDPMEMAKFQLESQTRQQELQMEKQMNQMKIQLEQQKLQIKVLEGQNKIRLENMKFEADERRQNMKLAGDMHRSRLETHANIATRALESQAKATQTPRAFDEN